MIITITAPSGCHKTKTALEIGAKLGLENNQKVIYFTKDKDYMGWKSHVESLTDKEKAGRFRPIYADSLKDALHILPHVDHLPYDFIIWDGFGSEFSKLSVQNYNAILHQMEEYAYNKNGKIIIIFETNTNFQE